MHCQNWEENQLFFSFIETNRCVIDLVGGTEWTFARIRAMEVEQQQCLDYEQDLCEEHMIPPLSSFYQIGRGGEALVAWTSEE